MTEIAPLDLDQRPLAVSSIEQILNNNYKGFRILVVEDDPINQEVVSYFLIEAGLAVEIANNGVEAIQKAESNEYALILMDMCMPLMDGPEATRRIRQLPHGQTIPIVAFTANTTAEDRRQCFVAGMNDFVAKPVHPETLFEIIIKWLETSATTRDQDEIYRTPTHGHLF